MSESEDNQGTPESTPGESTTPPAAAPDPVVVIEAPATPPRTSRLGGFDALTVRPYQFYALCAGLQQVAESMQMLANGWFAFELTGSTAILGLTVLAQAVPQTFLSFFGGVISDRFPRHRVWQVCNVFALLLPLWLAFSIFAGVVTWHDLVIRSFMFGILLAFRAPARQGIMTEVVGRDKIMSAVSINQMVMNIVQFIGPAISGYIIGWLGIEWDYLIIAFFYGLATLSLIPMKYERRNISLAQGANRGSFFDNIKDGLKYVARTPDVRAVLGLTLVSGAFAMPYMQLLPAFGRTVLHTTPSKLGLLSSITGIGALTGSLGVTLTRPKSRGKLYVRATIFTGIVLVAFCISQSFQVSAAIVFFIGISQAMRMNMSSTLIQTYTEDQYLGRVLSVNFTQNGLSSLMGFSVAIIAGAVGVRYAVMGTSILLLATGILWFLFSKRLGRLA